jgi:hypothetical protein
MENKPKNFKEAALSHIPLDIQQKMLEATKVETDGMGFLDAIAKNTPDVSPLPRKLDTQTSGYVSLAVDGHVIKVSIDPTEGAVTMLLYLLATVFSKDKKVAKILKQFNFCFYDQNMIQLYPKKGRKNGSK